MTESPWPPDAPGGPPPPAPAGALDASSDDVADDFSDGFPDGPAATLGTAALASALGRLADQALEPEVVPLRSLPPWGHDAMASPPEYRGWLGLWRAARAGAAPVTGPADGPLISVVVPVYRPAHWYFTECVRSVLDQTYGRWELCLCDDGSGDAELTAIMAGFAARDARIKVTENPANGGISSATNHALTMATGEFVALLDHDDLLEPEALAEVARAVVDHPDADVVYTDDDKLDEHGPLQPMFKPDWSPDLLLAYPYLGHLTALRRSLLEAIGGFRSEMDGSQDFDVMLRATERARRVVHVPRVLYHWRVVAGSAAGDTEAKPWAYAASRRAVEDAVVRRGIDAEVEPGPFLGSYGVRRRVAGAPDVGAVLVVADGAPATRRAVDHLAAGGPVAVVDRGSTEPEARALFERLSAEPGVVAVEAAGAGWAAAANRGARALDAELVVFVDPSVEPEGSRWREALATEALRPEVGPVGARLVAPDGTLRHAGLVLGLGGAAGPVLAGLPAGYVGYGGWDRVVRAVSAVSGECLMVRREVFEALGGFDETYDEAFADVDLCLRAADLGYRTLFTPHAQLVRREEPPVSGYQADLGRFFDRWGPAVAAGDPYFNPNLSRLVPWCALRMPGEDGRWAELVDDLRHGRRGLVPLDPRH